MTAIKKLIGKTIFLGPVSKRHIPKLAKWMNDLEVVKYTCQAAKMHTEEITKKFLSEGLHKQDVYYFGIFTKKGELIGGTDLREVDNIQRTATLGIVIGEKEHWNKGYGTEAVSLLTDYGFNVLNLNNIMLTVFDFNEMAVRCYEKAGFRIAGRRRKARYFAGEYYDEIFMDMLPSELDKSRIRGMLR